MKYRILLCPLITLQQKPLLLPPDALAFLVSALIPYNRDVYEEAVGAEILAACMKSVLCGAVSWVLCLGKALAQWFPSSLLSLSSHL